MRKQFTFYNSFWEVAKNIPTKKEKLQFFEMLCQYALEEAEPDLSTKGPCAATGFRIARPILERAHQRSKAALCANSLSKLP